MQRILVTGANGFVGSALLQDLATAGYTIRAAIRNNLAAAQLTDVSDIVQVGAIGADTVWQSALADVDCVIHLASRVHIMKEQSQDSLSAFRSVNVEGVQRLALEAIRRGVRRFIYLSTIKVHGEKTDLCDGSYHAFSEANQPDPQNPYAISKWEAELALQKIVADSAMELVILRPPLIYGPGVGANFLKLLRLINSRIPLPLANIHNRRSMVYIGNVTAAIMRTIDHPNAACKTYEIADAQSVSTPELIEALSKILARRVILYPLPQSWLRFAGKITNKSIMVDRLCNSLLVDASKISTELDWQPPFQLRLGLQQTAVWFRETFQGHPS